MVKQVIQIVIYSQNEWLGEVKDFAEKVVMSSDDVSYVNVKEILNVLSDATYPAEPEENPDEYEELTKEELERQDFVDNTIMDMIRALCGDDEYNGELVGDVRDLVIGYYALPREFYPYLQKKE